MCIAYQCGADVTKCVYRMYIYIHIVTFSCRAEIAGGHRNGLEMLVEVDARRFMVCLP